jgi:tetratricopeptide (TPR) repeat protein
MRADRTPAEIAIVCICLKALIAFGAMLFMPSAVVAQEAGPTGGGNADEVARSLFQAGRTSYDSGEYQDALQFFQQAYDRSHRPELLYNIGQTADRLRLDDVTLATFRKYLELLPAAPNRTEVENRIRALDALVATRGAPSGAPRAVPTPHQTAALAPSAEPAIPTTGDEARDGGSVLGAWWFWTGAGAVVVAAIVVTVIATSGGAAQDPAVPGGTGVVVMTLTGP